MNNSELDRIIAESFGVEPDFKLRDDFALRITSELVKRSQWKADLYEYLYITAFLLVIMSALTLIYYFIDKNLLIQIFTFISNNIVQVAFGFLLFNFILFADRVLLRFLFNRWKINY